MDSTRLQITEQPALRRSAVVYKILVDGATPARTAVAQHLATKEKGTVVVPHLYPTTGRQAVLAHAFVYKDASTAAALTRPNLLAKQQPKAEPKAEEVPAAEAA
jgi:ribosomal protein S24E